MDKHPETDTGGKKAFPEIGEERLAPYKDAVSSKPFKEPIQSHGADLDHFTSNPVRVTGDRETPQ